MILAYKRANFKVTSQIAVGQDDITLAAAMDVYDPEPIPADVPLLRLPNVIITPHIGSASTQTRARMAVMTAENILAGLSGKRLPFCANPEVYEVK